MMYNEDVILIALGLPEGAITVAAEALKELKPSSATQNVRKNPHTLTSSKPNPVNIYEKVDSEGFTLIGNFVSARRAGQFMGTSPSSITKHMQSGVVYKGRYRLSSSSKAPK